MKQKLQKSLWLRLCAVIAMVLCGAGTTWGETTTENLNIETYANQKKWQSQKQYTSATVGNVTFSSSTNSGANTGCYYTTDHTWRFYSNEGAKLTISVPEGYSLVSVTPTFTVKDNGTLLYNNSTCTSGTEVSVSGTSVVFTISQSSGNKGKIFFTEIAVTYEAPIPAYTITAVSNDVSYGTVSLTGTTITATPAEGYTYADPAYSVNPANSATVVQDGNEFTVTPSANTMVTINFEAIPTYTVTLGDDNSTLTETIGGAGVTLPSRSALNGYDFAGWSATNVSTETTTAPTIIPAGSYTPTANITLYPIYTKTGGGTTPSAFSVGNTGNYAIVSAEQSGKYYALPTSPTVSSGKITAQEITVSESNGVKYITTANANGFTWTIASDNNGYTLSDGSKYIYHSNGGASGTNLAYGTSTSYTWAFTADGNYVTMAGMNGSTINNRGLLFSGTTIGGYALSNANSSGYYKVMILPISAGSTTYYWSSPKAAVVEIPTIVIAENPFLFSTTATITCATNGATIMYSYDGENWSEYSSSLTITETKTIYAKAINGENESATAQLTATKNLAMPTVTVSGDLTLDLDGETNVNAGTLTATVTYNDVAVDGATVTWSSNKPEVATIDASTGAVIIKTTGSVTFTATYAGNSDYAEAMANKTVSVIDNNAPGSAGNPYTVAQAIAYINTLGSSTSANEIYVSGIISKVDEYFGNFKSITYWISDDGTTTNQMEVYSGKGINGADFSAVTDLAVGYKVKVKGKVKMYNGTPEFDKSSVIVSLIRPTHTATFYQNGEKLSEATVEEGAAIEFPTPEDAIHGKQFVGWLPEEINGTTNEASPFTEATMGTTDVTYYAVYATVGSGSPASLTKMTSSDTFATGDKIVIVASDNIAMYQETANTSYVNKYTYDNNVATVAANDKNWLSVSAGSTNDTWKLGDDTNGYVYNGSSNNLVISTDNSTDFTLSWNSTESKFTFVGNNRWLSYRSDLDNKYFRMGGAYTSEGSGDIYFDIYKYNVGNIAYSDYCTTVVAPVTPAAPIVFHDSGEYEGTLSVPMFAQEGATIKYTVNGGDEQTYSTPVELSTGETTITAWAELNGVASDVVTKKYTIVEKAKGAVVEDGYYTIQTNEGKYVNVAGRKTVTLVNDTKSAGTVIRVKADEDGVKVLRSQAVDLPRYAERAMSYVPELVKEVVNKLAANVNDPIIGEQGAELILDKFNKEFDYHLYLEGENNTYRIYGRTPSMKPVVDFYAENKELVDSRLPKVEDFVKEVLQKIVDKVGRGQSVVDMFKVKTIWEKMGGKLTDPDVDQAKFFEEVLTSEENVWSFAYQTGMLYWDKVESYLTDNISELGDYGKYIEKIPQIRPNFKYYIVPSASGVDIISEGNSEIADASTAWTLTKRDGFDVTFDASLSKNDGKEMYKTLYVDFAYELPENENVKALKVKSVTEAGFAETEEITGVVPAQTPVLLMSTDVENLTKTLSLSTADGAAVTNELKGNDWLINKFEINTPELETIFALLTKLSSSLGEKYEYLKRKNAGTVNNKYFFGLSVPTPTEEGDFKEAFMNGKIKVLTNGEKGLGFYSNFDKDLVGNEVFMFSEDTNPILLTLKGDVYRDGVIDNKDLTALVEIVLGKVTLENKPENYDFDAAHVNEDEDINIADVTALVNILK